MHVLFINSARGTGKKNKNKRQTQDVGSAFCASQTLTLVKPIDYESLLLIAIHEICAKQNWSRSFIHNPKNKNKKSLKK